MALQLAYTTGQGVDANYWRIKEITTNYDDVKTELSVALYKDSAARTAGKESLLINRYFVDNAGWFDAATQDVVDQNPQERAYEYLKTLAEFSGATDV